MLTSQLPPMKISINKNYISLNLYLNFYRLEFFSLYVSLISFSTDQNDIYVVPYKIIFTCHHRLKNLLCDTKNLLCNIH